VNQKSDIDWKAGIREPGHCSGQRGENKNRSAINAGVFFQNNGKLPLDPIRTPQVFFGVTAKNKKPTKQVGFSDADAVSAIRPEKRKGDNNVSLNVRRVFRPLRSWA
jgi:hypothetical protein